MSEAELSLPGSPRIQDPARVSALGELPADIEGLTAKLRQMHEEQTALAEKANKALKSFSELQEKSTTYSVKRAQ
jgi:hypothetical protein